MFVTSLWRAFTTCHEIVSISHSQSHHLCIPLSSWRTTTCHLRKTATGWRSLPVHEALLCAWLFDDGFLWKVTSWYAMPGSPWLTILTADLKIRFYRSFIVFYLDLLSSEWGLEEIIQLVPFHSNRFLDHSSHFCMRRVAISGYGKPWNTIWLSWSNLAFIAKYILGRADFESGSALFHTFFKIVGTSNTWNVVTGKCIRKILWKEKPYSFFRSSYDS